MKTAPRSQNKEHTIPGISKPGEPCGEARRGSYGYQEISECLQNSEEKLESLSIVLYALTFANDYTLSGQSYHVVKFIIIILYITFYIFWIRLLKLYDLLLWQHAENRLEQIKVYIPFYNLPWLKSVLRRMSITYYFTDCFDFSQKSSRICIGFGIYFSIIIFLMTYPPNLRNIMVLFALFVLALATWITGLRYGNVIHGIMGMSIFYIYINTILIIIMLNLILGDLKVSLFSICAISLASCTILRVK